MLDLSNAPLTIMRILYAWSQWFSTDEITSCYSMCLHGPTMLNKQTNLLFVL